MKHFYRLWWMLFAFTALVACEKDNTTTPSEPQQLGKTVLTLAECTNHSFSVTWPAVEHAANYAYRVELGDQSQTVITESLLQGGESQLTLSVDKLLPETAYKVSVTAQPSEEDAELFTPSETAILTVTTLAKEAPDLPSDMFEIELGITGYQGIQYTFKPKDPLMLYTNILIDERYLTEDGLTDEDFSDQIIDESNQMLKELKSLQTALDAEFFYIGEYSGTGFAGKTPGTRLFFALMGVTYDEATNTVTPATKISRSEIFEITDEPLPAPDEPWADMLNPVYETYKGQDVVSVEVVPNETGEGYVFGKVYRADYRNSHSDYEIIQELTDMNNMSETMIVDWDLHLRGEMAPGEQRLFAVTCLYKDSGKQSSKLNWMILEAPNAIGGKVRIVDSASGQKDPEPEPEPEPTTITFETSISVDGTQVAYTITPSDPNAYFFMSYLPADSTTTPEESIQSLIDYFDWAVGYYEWDSPEQYLESETDLYKGNLSTTEAFDPGSYKLIFQAVGFSSASGTLSATPCSEIGTLPFTVEEVIQPAGPTVDITVDHFEDVANSGWTEYAGNIFVYINVQESDTWDKYRISGGWEDGSFEQKGEAAVLEFLSNPDNEFYNTPEGAPYYDEKGRDDTGVFTLGDFYSPDWLGKTMEFHYVAIDADGHFGAPAVLKVTFPQSL